MSINRDVFVGLLASAKEVILVIDVIPRDILQVLTDKTHSITWSTVTMDKLHSSIASNEQQNVYIVDSRDWEKVMTRFSVVYAVDVVELVLKSCDKSILWNAKPLKSLKFNGAQFLLVSFGDHRKFRSYASYINAHNGILVHDQDNSLSHGFVVIVGNPRNRTEVIRVCNLKLKFGSSTSAGCILSGGLEHERLWSCAPDQFLMFTAPILSNLSFAVLGDGSVDTEIPRLITSLGGRFQEGSLARPGSVILHSENFQLSQAAPLLDPMKHIFLQMDWLLRVHQQQTFLKMDKHELHVTCRDMPSSHRDLNGFNVLVQLHYANEARTEAIRLVRKCGGNLIVEMPANSTKLTVITENALNVEPTPCMITLACLKQLEAEKRAHLCSFHHFPVQVPNQPCLAGKSFNILLAKEEFTYIASVLRAMGGVVEYADPLLSKASHFITDGQFFREIAVELYNSGRRVLMFTYVLQGLSILNAPAEQAFLFDPFVEYASEPLTYAHLLTQRISTAATFGDKSDSDLKAQQSPPSGFPSIEFMSGEFDQENPIKAAVMDSLALAICRYDNFLLVDFEFELLVPNTGLLCRRRDDGHALSGLFRCQRPERVTEWMVGLCMHVQTWLESMGLECLTVEDRKDRMHVLFYDRETKGGSFGSFFTATKGAGTLVTIHTSRNAFEVFRDCIVPSKVAIPSVIVICYGGCYCSEKYVMQRELTELGYTSRYIHVHSAKMSENVKLIEAGSPLLISVNKDEIIGWARISGSRPIKIDELDVVQVENLLLSADKKLMSATEDIIENHLCCHVCMQKSQLDDIKLYVLYRKCKCGLTKNVFIDKQVTENLQF